jgi:hypothetical protein
MRVMKGASRWLEAKAAVELSAIDADNAVAKAYFIIFISGTSRGFADYTELREQCSSGCI